MKKTNFPEVTDYCNVMSEIVAFLKENCNYSIFAAGGSSACGSYSKMSPG